MTLHQLDKTQSMLSEWQPLLSEWRQLARLGGPILITQLSQMINGVIDTMMAGHYSARDLAGVAIGNSIWMPVFLFFLGILSALQPTVSGHRGAGSMQHVVPTVWQGIYIALLCSALMIVLLLNAQPLLHWLQLEPETAAITHNYLQGFAWGVPAMLLMVALRGFTDGLGHTRVVMAMSLLSNIINLPFNYVLIYGRFGFPELGGAGCGWATSIANICSLLALLVFLHHSHLFRHFPLTRSWHLPQKKILQDLLWLGVPIGFTFFFEVSMFTVIALLIAPLGPIVVAAHQLTLNFVSLMFMVPLSLGMALTLRVSFLIGAGQTWLAQKLARWTLLLALGIAMINIPLLLFGRYGIASLYTNDQNVIHTAVTLLQLAAGFQLADVLQVTAISGLRGYRDTRMPMLMILLSFWGIGLPLGYALAFSSTLSATPLGAAGFWMGLIAGLVVACVLLLTRLFLYRSAKTAHA